MRGAKRKAREFGAGSLIVRNFNRDHVSAARWDWWQTEFCWVWHGWEFKKALPVFEKKWIVADTWQNATVLRQYRSSRG